MTFWSVEPQAITDSRKIRTDVYERPFGISQLITTSADSTTCMDSETMKHHEEHVSSGGGNGMPTETSRKGRRLGVPSEGSFVGRSRKRLGTGTASAGTDLLIVCDCLAAEAHVTLWSKPSGALMSVVFSACSDVTDGEISRLRSALFPEYRNWEKLAGDLGIPPLLVGSRSSPS